MTVDQRGLTLVETLLATAIATMIVGLLGSTLFMFMRSTEQGNKQLIAYQDLQNAGYWISQDGMAAQTTNLVTDGGQSNTVTYSLSGDDLKRNHNGTVMSVARNISNVNFSISQRVITGNITSSPASRWGVSKEAIYKVSLRPTG
jgi:type II secretory pathway pseudopilin PulG